MAATQAWGLRAQPRRQHCRRFAGKHKSFLALVASRAAPTASRREFGKEKGAAMKFATVCKSLVMGSALLLATGAFAATKANLELSSTATVAGTTLKAGDYKLEWDGSGPNVEVSIMKGKNVVAKVPAKVVDLSAPAPSDSLVFSSDNGSNTLAQVRFNGRKYALELAPTGDGQGGSSK
jgi:hypothetical protein